MAKGSDLDIPEGIPEYKRKFFEKRRLYQVNNKWIMNLRFSLMMYFVLSQFAVESPFARVVKGRHQRPCPIRHNDGSLRHRSHRMCSFLLGIGAQEKMNSTIFWSLWTWKRAPTVFNGCNEIDWTQVQIIKRRKKIVWSTIIFCWFL